MDWVEHGVAPDAIIDPIFDLGEEVRTRRLCPYPHVARYTGEGSIDDAENFICIDLEPTTAVTGIQIIGISSNITSNVMAGETVEFTVHTVVMEKQAPQVEYQFFVRAGYGAPDWGGNKWQVVQGWSTTNSVNIPFDTAGKYFVAVHCETQGNSWERGDPQGGFSVEVSRGP